MNKSKARIIELEQTLAATQLSLQQASAQVKEWSDKWIESERSKGPAMADSMERASLEKKLLVIGHITAGRSNEAITEILTPLPVIIKLDIHFADDKAQMAHEQEMLNKVKKTIAQAVDSVQFAPTQGEKKE